MTKNNKIVRACKFYVCLHLFYLLCVTDRPGGDNAAQVAGLPGDTGGPVCVHPEDRQAPAIGQADDRGVVRPLPPPRPLC